VVDEKSILSDGESSRTRVECKSGEQRNEDVVVVTLIMSDIGIKDLHKSVLKWFNGKLLSQKVVWILYFIIFVYGFFATKTRSHLFVFLLISLPAILLVDWLFGKLRKG
jgi:hypothetical protein